LAINEVDEKVAYKKYLLRALPVVCLFLLVLLLPKNLSFLSMMGMIAFGVYLYLSIIIVGEGVSNIPNLIKEKI
jgi:hypothetical protein